jgi:predicted nuclease with TOPRIM domain
MSAANLAAMRAEIEGVFPPEQAKVLTNALADAMGLQQRYFDEMSALRGEVRELARAQQRTEQRVEQLAEAQQRTEQRVEQLADEQRKLAQAQQRTEQRLEQLAEAQQRTEQRLEQLAEAQQRTEQRVEQLADEQRKLAQAQQRTEQRVEQLADEQRKLAQAQQKTEHALQLLARQVGGLSDKLGGSLEDLAIETLPYVLSEAWGIEVSDCGHDSFIIDGREVDVDLVLRGTIGGANVVVLGEVKARLTAREVDAFLQRVEQVRSVVGCDDVRAVFFGFQANLDARHRIREAGAAMVFSNGRLL